MRSSRLLLAETLPRSPVGGRVGLDSVVVASAKEPWAAIPDAVKVVEEDSVGLAGRQEASAAALGARAAVWGSYMAEGSEGPVEETVCTFRQRLTRLWRAARTPAFRITQRLTAWFLHRRPEPTHSRTMKNGYKFGRF